MNPLFRKLNLGDLRVVHLIGAPSEFDAALQGLDGVTIKRKWSGRIEFAIEFVTTFAQVEAAASAFAAGAEGDALLWLAYPKGSSKRYSCEFNRDTGWARLGELGYEPVRQVAIDDDWTALRFRRADFIKVMTRNPDGALSATGRKKALAQRASRPPKPSATRTPRRTRDEPNR
jgi:hypothetical protein